MSTFKPIQVIEGEWYRWNTNEWLQCCDCGLTHRLEVRRRDGHLEIRFFVDNRATGQVRRHSGVTVITTPKRKTKK